MDVDTLRMEAEMKKLSDEQLYNMNVFDVIDWTVKALQEAQLLKEAEEFEKQAMKCFSFKSVRALSEKYLSSLSDPK